MLAIKKWNAVRAVLEKTVVERNPTPEIPVCEEVAVEKGS